MHLRSASGPGPRSLELPGQPEQRGVGPTWPRKCTPASSSPPAATTAKSSWPASCDIRDRAAREALVRAVDERFGGSTCSCYAATKAGVGLTRKLAAQWGRPGVRVNAPAPSFFPGAATGWLQDPDQVAWIRTHTALGRSRRPDELDGTLLFLAGDASSYGTGQTRYVDGGWTDH